MTKHKLQRNSRFLTVVALVTVAALVSGCNKKEQPAPVAAPSVPAQVTQQQVKAAQKPISSATVKPLSAPTVNQFDFSGKKDPFKPDIALKTVTAPSQADINKMTQGGLPIHSFDVSQFKLIGIVTGGKENQAMVVDPNGKGYVLKTGMTIGKNDGRIMAVNINGVEIVEQFKDDSGRVRKENIRITLPRKQ
jgi:type IV pilus assembly protein PilP